MYRLNTKITEEAEAILKEEAKRIGASMGTIVTIWALQHKKEEDALRAIDIYGKSMKAEQAEAGQASGVPPQG